MIGTLPTSLAIDGVSYRIRSDFRTILYIFDEVFNNVDFDDYEKAYLCVQILYIDKPPDELFVEAVKQAYWFCNGGSENTSDTNDVRIIDWNHDEKMIMPAVSKVAGVIDIRSLPYLHFFTFLGFFGEIENGLLSTVLHIRQKRANGKKLDKAEKEFFSKNKDLIIIHTAEELAEIEKTNEVLKSLGIE